MLSVPLLCVPHTWNSMLSVPPFPPTEASLASFVVSAATYDIVSELKALLFVVTFGHFTINIVDPMSKMFEIVNFSS